MITHFYANWPFCFGLISADTGDNMSMAKRPVAWFSPSQKIDGVSIQHPMANMFSESEKESPAARNRTNLFKIFQIFFV